MLQCEKINQKFKNKVVTTVELSESGYTMPYHFTVENNVIYLIDGVDLVKYEDEKDVFTEFDIIIIESELKQIESFKKCFNKLEEKQVNKQKTLDFIKGL